MTSSRSLPLVSLLAVGCVLAAWWIAGATGSISPLILPPPGEVLLTANDLIFEGYRGTSLITHVAVSLLRAIIAFVAASITGCALGLLMGMSPVVYAVFDPFVQFLRPLPKLALIPLVIVWFGIGEFSKFLLIYLATFLSVVVSANAAVMSVSQGRIRAAVSLGANRWQLFRHVLLPSALPELFIGIRVGLGIGWTTLIAAEMIAATTGVGWMVMNASSYLRTDVVMLGIFILGVTGYALDYILVSTQKYFVHWMGKA